MFDSNDDFTVWSGVITTLLGTFLGGWIVYLFTVRIENKKKKIADKENFEILKRETIRTLEELKSMGSYISEYLSKANYQIKRRETTGYFNENIYNIRVAKFDDFRIKYVEIRSRLLMQTEQLIDNSHVKTGIEEKFGAIREHDTPAHIAYAEINLVHSDGSDLTEADLDQMIKEKLAAPGELHTLILALETEIRTLNPKKS